jgi:hypothetical protein
MKGVVHCELYCTVLFVCLASVIALLYLQASAFPIVSLSISQNNPKIVLKYGCIVIKMVGA